MSLRRRADNHGRRRAPASRPALSIALSVAAAVAAGCYPNPNDLRPGGPLTAAGGNGGQIAGGTGGQIAGGTGGSTGGSGTGGAPGDAGADAATTLTCSQFAASWCERMMTCYPFYYSQFSSLAVCQ